MTSTKMIASVIAGVAVKMISTHARVPSAAERVLVSKRGRSRVSSRPESVRHSRRRGPLSSRGEAMDTRAPSNGRDRTRTARPLTTRRGYAFPRAEHRLREHGTQARRESRQMPYVVGFVIVVLALAAF